MSLDTTINLPTLVVLGLAIISFIVWLVRLESRVAANGRQSDDLARELAGLVRARDTSDTEWENKLGAIQALITLHKEQFHAYQLQVARDYTTHNVVAEIKRDIITEIGRMEQRVEVQITRLVDKQK